MGNGLVLVDMGEEILYNSAKYESEQEAYDALSEVISRVSESLHQTYFVAWESENHEHHSTQYTVTDTGNIVGEDTLFIEGGRGGTYEIVPKPGNPPRIRYHHPSGDVKWDEEARLLMIASTDYVYEKKGEEAWFIEYYDEMRDRLGI